jgi:putative ABC transport system permease protein
MLQHHILSSLRWLKRHLTFSAINVFGFGISLACCLAIGLYLNTELSYDRFHLKKYRIYRYIPRSNEDGSVAMQTWTPTGLGALLHFSFMKEVEAVCRLSWQSEKPSFKDGERDL